MLLPNHDNKEDKYTIEIKSMSVWQKSSFETPFSYSHKRRNGYSKSRPIVLYNEYI